MSREYLWEYQIPGPDAGEKWDAFWGFPDAECHCEAVACHKAIQGGGGSPDRGFEITLWANKAKARRIAARLDAHFGGTGSLARWVDS